MRAFLSKFLLSIFIVIFSLPLSALAQENSWTPPSGPPLGNNTPAPINEGIFPQIKRGGLRLDTNDTFPGASFQTFLPSFFLNHVQIGRAANPFGNGGAGRNLTVNGSFKFKPLELDGQPTDSQPQPGYVLTALDADGNVGWVPASGGPGGGTSLPSATLGQTMWYDGNAWQATNQVLHGILPDGVTTFTRIPNRDITIGALGLGRTLISSTLVDIPATEINIGTGTLGQQTNIKSPIVRIPLNNAYCAPVCPGPDPTGKVLVAQDSTGRLGWVNPGDIFTGGGTGNLPPAEQGNTLWYNNGAWEATTKINHTDTDTIVDSNNFKIRGSETTPGQGRIPFSIDNEGTFKWNDRFTYQLNQGGMFPAPIGQLTLLNPENGIAVFRNQGMSSLVNDVRIGEEEGSGELYLKGLTTGTIAERYQGQIEPLCYSTSTKRVVTCDVFRPFEDGEGTRDPLEGVAVYTPDSAVNTHTFDITGTVEVKYCAGGGGGGGGGWGRPSPGTNNSPGTGGAGGGGGGAGECDTIDLAVTPGDVLRFDIGEGGAGGAGAFLQQTDGQPIVSSSIAGGVGGVTSIYFTNDGGPEVQLGDTMAPGGGGSPGASASDNMNQAPVGGASGNPSLNIGGDSWWYRGQNGLINTYSVCSSCGGHGGVGEAYNSSGNILGPNQVSAGQPSWRGGGGYASNNQNTKFGQNGRCGSLSFGGGGGGGGYGQYVWYDLVVQLRGGNGGCGGDGYVQITGLAEPEGPNFIEFNTPGGSTLTSEMINNIPPGAVLTVEIWGAGGGGGGSAMSNATPNAAGGGGAGAYVRLTNVPRPSSPVTISIGSGGQAGVSSSTQSNVTDGENGGSSNYGSFTATGGRGGKKSLTGMLQTTGVGGMGGVAIGGSVNLNGQNGQTGSTANNNVPASGGAGHSALNSGSTLYGAGGAGAKEYSGPGFDYANNGQNGRVRISW